MTGIPQRIIGRFKARTAKSQALHARACQVLPGGDTRTGVYYAPYPATMVEGNGATLVDLDGNQYFDFLNNYTSLVHGHGHPGVMAVVREQLTRGSVYASPMIGQVELAELLCARVPGVDMVRYTNSGSEATMVAIRAARGFTGRAGIVKMQGAYHGSHDLAVASGNPDSDRGIPDAVRDDLFWAPFNDLGAVERLLAEHGRQIAAVIVEPVPNAGGLPLPRPGYLRGLRDLVDRHSVLLIFDEVVTLRLNEGGYQTIAGVIPDLTAMGKIIGGGFAVGAFGGKREIMLQFDPSQKGHIAHSGTFNGHGLTMAAGLASLRCLDREAIDRINELGRRLAMGFDRAFLEAGIRGRTTQAGSLVQIHWRSEVVENMGDVQEGFRAAGDLPYLLHLELMNRGIFAAPRGEYNTTSVMDSRDIERAVGIFGEVLADLKPHVQEVNQALVCR